MKNQRKIFASLLIICIVYALFERVFEQQLMKNSIIIQKILQSMSGQLQDLSFIISNVIVLGVIGIITFYSFFLFWDRIRGLVILIYIGLSVGLVPFLKMVFKQERPYMIDEEIKTFDCECDYGYPSGHSFTAVSIAFIFYEIMWKKR